MTTRNGLGSDWGSRKYKHLSPAARKALRKDLDIAAKQPACFEADVLTACNRLELFDNPKVLLGLLSDFRDGTAMWVTPNMGLILVQKAIMAHRLAAEAFPDSNEPQEKL